MKRRMTEMIEVRQYLSSLPKHSNSIQGIRKATAWYTSHLSLTRPTIRGQPAPKIPVVVLLTEDAANRRKAEESGMFSISVRKYVEAMPSASQMLDLLSAEGSNDIEPTKAVAGRQALYPEVSHPMSTP